MRLKYDFVIREIDDIPIAVVVGDDYYFFNGVVKLNSSGRAVFEMINGKDATLDDIVSNLMDKFDVDKKTAEKSVILFLDELRKSDLVIE